MPCGVCRINPTECPCNTASAAAPSCCAFAAVAGAAGSAAAQFDLTGFQRDLATLEALRPTLLKMARLHERLQDTEMALGSDLMTNVLEGYGVLKVAGKGAGLDSLRRMLSARFNRSRAVAVEEAVPAV